MQCRCACAARHVRRRGGERGCATARALYATRPFTPEGVFLAVSLTLCYCGGLAWLARVYNNPHSPSQRIRATQNCRPNYLIAWDKYLNSCNNVCCTTTGNSIYFLILNSSKVLPFQNSQNIHCIYATISVKLIKEWQKRYILRNYILTHLRAVLLFRKKAVKPVSAFIYPSFRGH